MSTQKRVFKEFSTRKSSCTIHTVLTQLGYCDGEKNALESCRGGLGMLNRHTYK